MLKTFMSTKLLGEMSILLGAAALLMGCATSPGAGVADEQMAAAGVDTKAVRRGRALAVTGCAECHRFFWPHEYSEEEWRGIIPKMSARAGLSESQSSDLGLYLIETGRARVARQEK